MNNSPPKPTQAGVAASALFENLKPRWRVAFGAFLLFLCVASTAWGARVDELAFNSGQKAKLAWEAGPANGIESRFRLEWREADGERSFHPSAFRVRLWMPAHGHGSSPVEIRAVMGPDGNPARGEFQVAKVYFTMKGEWEVQITLRNVEGAEETRSLTLDLGRGHH